MTEPHAVKLYQSQLERHRTNARSSLEEALRRMQSALERWDEGPSVLNVSNARHAVQYAAEGYAELQAFVALQDMHFLMDPDPAPKEG